jgi:hypothetical protein
MDEEGVFSFDPREGQSGLPVGEHRVQLIAQTAGGAPVEMDLDFSIGGEESQISTAAIDAAYALIGECGEG